VFLELKFAHLRGKGFKNYLQCDFLWVSNSSVKSNYLINPLAILPIVEELTSSKEKIERQEEALFLLIDRLYFSAY